MIDPDDAQDYTQEQIRPMAGMEDTVAADNLELMSRMGQECWEDDTFYDYY